MSKHLTLIVSSDSEDYSEEEENVKKGKKEVSEDESSRSPSPAKNNKNRSTKKTTKKKKTTSKTTTKTKEPKIPIKNVLQHSRKIYEDHNPSEMTAEFFKTDYDSRYLIVDSENNIEIDPKKYDHEVNQPEQKAKGLEAEHKQPSLTSHQVAYTDIYENKVKSTTKPIQVSTSKLVVGLPQHHQKENNKVNVERMEKYIKSFESRALTLQADIQQLNQEFSDFKILRSMLATVRPIADFPEDMYHNYKKLVVRKVEENKMVPYKYQKISSKVESQYKLFKIFGDEVQTKKLDMELMNKFCDAKSQIEYILGICTEGLKMFNINWNSYTQEIIRKVESIDRKPPKSSS